MLKYGEPNPLTIFGLRQLEYCPPHFTRVQFDITVNEKNITDWIWLNLSGRFWFGDYYFKTDGNTVSFQKCAAFELPGEASMFALVLDQINKYDFEL